MPRLRTIIAALFPLSLALAQGDWRPMYPTNPPLPFGRDGVRMAFDAARSRIVLFGGSLIPGGLMNDTWTYDGMTWTQQSPMAAPTARSQHAMCYDSVRQLVVLFGGQSAGMPFGDTWEWDGSTWTQRLTPRAPSARFRSGLAFDGSRSLLFGGQSGTALGDTWALNAAGWTQLSPAAAPSARSGHQLASNGAGEALLFGGGAAPNNETWLFNGTTWTQQTPTTPPPVRSQPYLVHDPVVGRYLLFGGTNFIFQPQEDTWSFAAGQWTQLPTVRAPSTRGGGAAVWYPPQQRMVIQGGAMAMSGDLRSGIQGWEFGNALASFMPWGERLCPALDPPLLRGAGQPTLGGTFRAEVVSFSAVASFVIMGFSTTSWAGGALPYDLVTFGTWPNCMLRVRPEATAYIGFGQTTTWTLAIPPSASYVGVQFHLQGFTFGAGSFPTNLSTANAGTGIVDLN